MAAYHCQVVCSGGVTPQFILQRAAPPEWLWWAAQGGEERRALALRMLSGRRREPGPNLFTSTWAVARLPRLSGSCTVHNDT